MPECRGVVGGMGGVNGGGDGVVHIRQGGSALGVGQALGTCARSTCEVLSDLASSGQLSGIGGGQLIGVPSSKGSVSGFAFCL
ncbi:unnamed protein product, partial [Ilex paraguariensis]